MEMEKRAIGEVRAVKDDLYIEGYFIKFNSVTEIYPGYQEQIDPHALDETINDDIRCLLDHDTSKVLGRTSAGTAELTIDDVGVFARIKINPKDSDALNTLERVKRGDINQASFGFNIIKEKVERGVNGILSTITKLRLFEISVVTFPAYEDTHVMARSKRMQSTIDEQEKAILEKRKTVLLSKLKRSEKDA